MDSIPYRLLYALCYAISLVPLRILYIVSDGLGFLLYHIIRYRRHIVRKNLTESFPNKSKAEIVDIEKKFYLWLCDYMVETLKIMTFSEEEISRHMKFVSSELVKQSIDNGKSCAVYLGHYCNWEWVTSLPLILGDKAVCGQIYHALESKSFDSFFLKLRGRFGAESIPMQESFRHIVKHLNAGDKVVIGFIADQVPMWNSIHYWTDFLNHDTPVFTGAERIARKSDFDVYYLDMKRIRRGYYTGEFKLITNNVGRCEEFGVTEAYFRLLEDTITQAPQYWLWSHNRWKRKREKAINREDRIRR